MSRSAWGVLAAAVGSAGCLLAVSALAIVAAVVFVFWVLLTVLVASVQSAAAALAAWDALLSAAFGPTWWAVRELIRQVLTITSAG